MTLISDLQKEAQKRPDRDITLSQIQAMVKSFEEAGIDPEAPVTLEKWMGISGEQE